MVPPFFCFTNRSIFLLLRFSVSPFLRFSVSLFRYFRYFAVSLLLSSRYLTLISVRRALVCICSLARSLCAPFLLFGSFLQSPASLITDRGWLLGAKNWTSRLEYWTTQVEYWNTGIPGYRDIAMTLVHFRTRCLVDLGRERRGRYEVGKKVHERKIPSSVPFPCPAFRSVPSPSPCCLCCQCFHPSFLLDPCWTLLPSVPFVSILFRSPHSIPLADALGSGSSNRNMKREKRSPKPEYCDQANSSLNVRPINIRRISCVPAPTVYRRASRSIRATGYSACACMGAEVWV